MDEREQGTTVDAGKADLPGSDTTTGLPSTAEQPDLRPTTTGGPANPSLEAEARNKSPEGGRSYDDDEVDVDPPKAPSANFFIWQVTGSMLVTVILLALAGVTGSTVLIILALASILIGLGFNLLSIFLMMSTD